MSNKEINPIEFEEQRRDTKHLFGMDMLMLIRLAVSFLCFLTGLFFRAGGTVRLVLMLCCFLSAGYDIVMDSVEKLLSRHTVDQDLLIIVASFIAFLIRLEVDGAALILLHRLTVVGLDYVSDRSRRSVDAEVDPRSGSTRVLVDEEEQTVSSKELRRGDVMILNPGDCADVDCIVIEGYSTVDLSCVTGSFEPVSVEEGDMIPAGARNVSSQLQTEVASVYNDSTMERMWAVINEEGENTRWEGWLELFTRYFAPVAVALAAVMTVLFALFGKVTTAEAIHRGLVFLVIVNPAGLAAALSLTYYTGLRGAAHRGVLFRGHAAMDTVATCKAMIFDKNGTVTTRDYSLESVRAARIDADTLIKAAAHAAANASNPKLKAVADAYGGPIDYSIIGNFIEYPEGLSVSIEGIPTLIGSRSFLVQNDVPLAAEEALEELALHMALAGRYAGSLLLSDSVQQGSSQAVQELEELGCRDVVLLSADSVEKTRALAQQCAISKYYAQCLPMDKLARIQELCERNKDGSTIYVGAADAETSAYECTDGGFYLGGLDSESSECASIIGMDGRIEKTSEALRSAKITRKIVIQGVAIVLGVKLVLLLLDLFGFSSQLWFAGLLDGFAAMGAVLNAVRAFPPEKLSLGENRLGFLKKT